MRVMEAMEVVEERIQWGELSLLMTTRIAADLPPLDLVNSVRSVVHNAGSVLLLRDLDGALNIVPGGRREPGESIVETLRREVREEAGIEVVGVLGVISFRHLGPMPEGYPYPYPEFHQIVYLSYTRDDLDPAHEIRDDWVGGAEYVLFDDARLQGLRVGQRALLSAAKLKIHAH